MLVDTDVAADDLVALTFLVSSPTVQLAGITVSGTGEAHCAGGVDIVLRLLDGLDAPDIPVACGRETPLAGSHTFPDAWRERVDQGSGLELAPTARTPSSSTAVELIATLAAEHESLTVLTLGPLTNLADALLNDPALAEQLGPVFVMGGALHVPGNLVCCGAPEGNSAAEWNIYVDPKAANVVVASGLEPSFVSLDGTNQVPVTPEFAARAMEPSDSAGRGILADLFAANPFMTDGSYFLWDPLAAQLAAGYEIGSFSPACVVVEEAEGPESGFTRPTCETPNIQYLTTVDPAAAEDTLLAVLNGD
jgi:pyrimidine-specific ribonucleoside hydrolase